VPEQEKFGFAAAVSLRHLPEEEWEKLLGIASHRVEAQLAVARQVLRGSPGPLHPPLESILAVYDRISEMMPRPFPDIAPAPEEEEETLPETEDPTPQRSSMPYNFPPHVDRTGD
jgi:hypothetical protein